MKALINFFSQGLRACDSIVDSMLVGLATLMTKPVTMQYPDVKANLPQGTRMQLHNIIDNCGGCQKCVRACPIDCITVETVKGEKGEDLGTTGDGKPRKLWVTRFDIDMAKCCCCNLCVYACPTNCLEMTDKYETSVTERTDLIYHFANLPQEKVAELKARAGKKKDKKGKKAKAAKELAQPKNEPKEGK